MEVNMNNRYPIMLYQIHNVLDLTFNIVCSVLLTK